MTLRTDFPMPNAERFGSVVGTRRATMTTLPPTPIPDNRKLVTNETAKLFANDLHRASTACFTVGAATPMTGWLLGASGLNQVP